MFTWRSFAPICFLLLVLGCSENVCDAPSDIPEETVWSGNVGGGGLRLELSELDNVVTGRAVITWPASLDSSPIRAGWLSGPDSFYLDLTEVPAPIGCTRMIMAEYSAPYGATGVYSERCGHDPFVLRFPWAAGKWDGVPTLYGSWAGKAGRFVLNMELTEAPDDSITGYVRLRWPSAVPETLVIRNGTLLMPDSIFLDVSDNPPAPFGCYRTLSGHFAGDGWMVGDFFENCGHDPSPLRLEWSAVRISGPD
jgi:hypothetical protein